MRQKGHFLLFDNTGSFLSWLDRQKVSRDVRLIQNHHTYKPDYSDFNGANHFELLESMRDYHMKIRGFDDIAQNLTTFPDGKIAYSLGRPFDRVPAGIKGANTNGICIEHLGNFDDGGDSMTETHKTAIAAANAALCREFGLPADTEHVVYHHWWSADGTRVYDLRSGKKLAGTSGKSCPGTAFFGGNEVEDARKFFIPLVIEQLLLLNRHKPDPDPDPDPSVTHEVHKVYRERVYAKNGTLIRCDGNYKIPATDVRWIKFRTGQVRFEFVYEKGAKVSELVKKYKADYGINGPFFYNGIPLGDTEDQDRVIASAYGKMLKWHEFAVVGGRPVIGQLDKNARQEFLFQAAPLLVENGKPVYEAYRKSEEVNDDIGKSRCQRTFVWLDESGDLSVGIADGRTKTDLGLTLEEMALFATDHGAVTALNFDGGGSTILADRTGGRNQKANTGANERPVHHALLIYINHT